MALTEGVPSPALFLAGYLDREQLAARTAPGHVLRIRVETGGAVDIVASEATPPRENAAALELDDVYLLPVGWLSSCRVTAIYEVSRSGDPVLTREVDGAPLRLAPAGASHGVDGLPEEAQRWPHGRLRSTATRYVLVPEAGGLGPWQRLHAHRPAPRPGPGILAVRVGRGQAIDITATASAMAGLTAGPVHRVDARGGRGGPAAAREQLRRGDGGGCVALAPRHLAVRRPASPTAQRVDR